MKVAIIEKRRRTQLDAVLGGERERVRTDEFTIGKSEERKINVFHHWEQYLCFNALFRSENAFC
jgi:hypothetical protein